MFPYQKKRFISIGSVLFLWLLANERMYSRYGVKVVNDSARYIEYGQGLLSGFYIDVHNFWYVGYSLFLAFVYKFGGDTFSVVAIQYFLNFLAAVALYQSCFSLWKSRRSAEVACLFFIWPDISQWNSYILTESLYVSFICFSLYGLVLIYNGERRWWILSIIAFIILFTIFIKPTGIALLGAISIVMISNVFKKIPNVSYRIVFVSIIFILFALLLNRMLTTYRVIENYQLGEIIYAVTSYRGDASVNGLVVQPPADIYNPPESYPPLIRIIAFIFHHPVYWTNLFLHKVFYLLAHIRPFWSSSHNLFSVAVLLITYISFFIGIRSKSISRDVVTFAITFLLIHILSVGITSEDWDGRFLIPMLPVIFIFSGHGLATWRYRKSSQ